MTEADIQRLKAAASDALKAGKNPLALRHCLDLEKLEPDDPMWPRRTALVLNRMGRPRDEVDALDRSAARYEKLGDVLKCATVCNQILQLDPEHATTKERLGRIHRSARANTPAAGVPVVRGVAPSTRWAEEPDSGIQRIDLREVMPGAARVKSAKNDRAGVYCIPLADEVSSPIDVSIEETGSLPLHLAAEMDVTMDGRGNLMAKAVADVRREVYGAAPVTKAALSEDDAILAVEAEFRAAAQTNEALTATPLFAKLSEKSFSDLLLNAKQTSVSKDREIFHQGDRGDALYVIAEGTVGVVDEGPPRRGITKLRDGDFFGEMALLSDQPRSATVIALEDVELIRIDRQVVKKLIVTDPEVLPVLLRFFRDRSVERLLATNPLFTVLSAKDRDALRSRFRFLEVEAGASLVDEGERAEGLIVLLAGQAEAVRTQNGKEVAIGVLGPGDIAGEMSILMESPGIATVRATEKCFAIELPGEVFLTIVKSRPKAKEFIDKVIQRRAAQVKAILSGQAQYKQGRVQSY
jgi:cAMP-dependent protein kinase regulator